MNHENLNFDQGNSHSRSLSLPPPGFINSSAQDFGQNAVRQEQVGYENSNPHYYVRKSPVPVLHRHHSTGSHNILVNERGEIIGHSSPVINQGGFEGHAQCDPGHNHFSQNRQQRSSSYGAQQMSQFNRNTGYNQSQEGVYHGFHAPTLHDDRSNSRASPPIDRHVDANDGMMQHQRHNTEPILPTVFSRNTSGGRVLSSRTISGTSDDFEQALAGEHIEGIDQVEEKPRTSSRGPAEKESCFVSYASTLMMSRPSSNNEQAAINAKGRGPRYESTSQPLTAGANLSKSGPKMVYNVKFKRTQRNFILGQRVAREVKIGCYVKVEADRGEDLGIVFSIIPMEKYLASNRPKPEAGAEEDSASAEGDGQAAPSHSVSVSDLKRIMRVATHDEISLLEVKRDEEEELLKVCRAKIRQRSLTMSVIDAEYQFDRNKLTFFFEAEGRIDFRELVRDLFSMYKTRIWMQQLDKDESPRNRVTSVIGSDLTDGKS